jgi:hypothetical protein
MLPNNPNMGGFAPNSYSGTMPFRFGTKLPAKPNPLASTQPAQRIEANPAGIQQAMNKRGETYHYGRTGKKPSEDIVDNPIKGAVGTRAGEKQARNLQLGNVPVGVGPQNMFNALMMLNQARSLVNPEKTLDKHRISARDFESMADELAEVSGDSYDFNALRRNPRRSAMLQGLLGAGAGAAINRLAGNKGILNTLGGAAVGGSIGAGAGYMDASGHNRRLLGTSKVLKDYGLLSPDYLRAALPLLKQSQAMCTSAAGEGKKKYKVDAAADAKGHDAFKSLDNYMKKAGLNSFQANFFGRLIQTGFNESQIRLAVKQANVQFGQAVAGELNDGLEKLAGPLDWMGRQFSGVKDWAKGHYDYMLDRVGTAIGKSGFNEADQKYSGLSNILSQLSGAGNYMKENPNVLPMGLMAMLGMGGGAMMGGRGGAMLGGFGLPLLYYLMQNPQMMESMKNYLPSLGGAVPPAAPAGAPQTPAAAPQSPAGAPQSPAGAPATTPVMPNGLDAFQPETASPPITPPAPPTMPNGPAAFQSSTVPDNMVIGPRNTAVKADTLPAPAAAPTSTPPVPPPAIKQPPAPALSMKQFRPNPAAAKMPSNLLANRPMLG